LLQFTRHDPSQLQVLGKPTPFWTTRRLPSCPVRWSGPIKRPSPMPGHFLAYRGNGSMQAPGDGAKCITRGDTSRNLFTFTETEYS
jgi:hypothetical protein